ncbi:hypothetical protein Pmar_PMAR011782 [Perkinsus marinus ATCC 50983]|uniref:Uncharacterized protein n=1 Tax=Perkinsus marinus (strain ATCC 50983 / TXsc) TaxID=423536 RepID=C5LCQ1_PERM5|nr:hypothetical protein Pmar_PMAR011782 [Perkinsus marinus ATCC 50983]EER05734.1 hypothetical protein Pmar_PMAR011782 [Perkinsus marinus ATCC 50983]|eukprot:XP_002773918.1 hypothetical protein Pmar_PMAR011782 [Perkinsus marinus ATCC 50983]
MPPLQPSSTSLDHSQPSSSVMGLVEDTYDTFHDILQESKIFRTLVLGRQEHHHDRYRQHQQPYLFLPLHYDTPQSPSLLHHSLLPIDTFDQRPSKYPRLAGSYCAQLENYDNLPAEYLPLVEDSPEVLMPDSPQLCCLNDDLSDVSELLLPPVCQDTPRTQRRSGLRKVVDRRRLVDRRKRMIRSFGLAEVSRGPEEYLSGIKRPAHSEDSY